MRMRFHHFSIGLVLFAATGVAVAQGWLKDPITACTVWSDKTDVERIVSWSGACADGKASGAGVLVVISAGKFDVRYDGTMVGGKANGLGLVHYRTVKGFASYAGQFADSTLHGRGLTEYPDGSHYEGEFVKDVPHGFGTYTAADGAIYQGQFVSGKPQGWGMLRYASGDLYTGEFKAGLPHGKGRWQQADGGVYEGDFVREAASGQGRYTAPSGDVFRGNFADNKPVGEIVLLRADGTEERQMWKDGERVE